MQLRNNYVQQLEYASHLRWDVSLSPPSAVADCLFKESLLLLLGVISNMSLILSVKTPCLRHSQLTTF